MNEWMLVSVITVSYNIMLQQKNNTIVFTVYSFNEKFKCKFSVFNL